MRNYVLNIGEAAVVKGAAQITCFGLGSCIGLFVQDRAVGLSGGAHILLPQITASQQEPDRYYGVGTALSHLLQEFRRHGSTLRQLRAKIAGGAHLFTQGPDVGGSNVQAICQALIGSGIYIAAQDVGGSQSRTARFDTTTGRLEIKTPETGTYRFF